MPHKGDRISDIPAAASAGKELFQDVFTPRRMHYMDSGHVRCIPDNIITTSQVAGAGEAQQIGVVDRARDILAGKPFHRP